MDMEFADQNFILITLEGATVKGSGGLSKPKPAARDEVALVRKILDRTRKNYNVAWPLFSSIAVAHTMELKASVGFRSLISLMSGLTWNSWKNIMLLELSRWAEGEHLTRSSATLVLGAFCILRIARGWGCLCCGFSRRCHFGVALGLPHAASCHCTCSWYSFARQPEGRFPFSAAEFERESLISRLRKFLLKERLSIPLRLRVMTQNRLEVEWEALMLAGRASAIRYSPVRVSQSQPLN